MKWAEGMKEFPLLSVWQSLITLSHQGSLMIFLMAAACPCWVEETRPIDRPTFSRAEKSHSQRTNLLFSRKPVGLGFYKRGCPWPGTEDTPVLSSRFFCWLPLVWNVPMAGTFLSIFHTDLLSCPFLSLHCHRMRSRRRLRLCFMIPPLSISTWAVMKYLSEVTWRVWVGSSLEPQFPTSHLSHAVSSSLGLFP